MLEDTPAAWSRGDHRISTDRAVVAPLLPAALELLRTTHWAKDFELSTLERAARNCICFALTRHDRLVGFARVVTDLATFAYLTDVVVAPGARGAGLGGWIVECILAHPDLQRLRRVSLLTRDAQTLYERAGFVSGAGRQVYMERRARPAGPPAP